MASRSTRQVEDGSIAGLRRAVFARSDAVLFRIWSERDAGWQQIVSELHDSMIRAPSCTPVEP
jgi:hypothetical protein